MSNNKVKYKRTYHFDFSEGRSSDDKILYDLSNFIDKEVVATEKMDGENTTMMSTCYYARSLDSNNHPSRNWVKGIWGKIQYEIPEDWRICGENLYATHSIHYTDLPSYFMVFNIWNEKNFCLSWDETVEWCKLLGLEHVPVLYRGVFDLEAIKKIKIDPEKQEGFVIRIVDSFSYEDFSKSIAKYVRKGHVQTDEHWVNQKIVPNELKTN
jgi:hypothetical protein